MIPKWLVLLVLGVLLTPLPFPGETGDRGATAAAASGTPTTLQKQGPASITTTAQVRDGQIEIRLSGTLQLTLALDNPAGEVKVPSPVTSSEVWKVQPGKPAQQKDTWQQTFHFLPLAPGKHKLQLEALEYQNSDGTWKSSSWKPLDVTVTTEISKADLSELRDITDIEQVPAPPSAWEWAKWLAVGVAGIAILFTGTWLWQRRRRKTAPALTPEQWASRELERIRILNLPATGELERYHTLLSNVIRRYLERRFQLPARRQTTPEFLQTMENASPLSPDQRAVLREFLERCDLAKFAPFQPSLERCQEMAAMAQQLIAEPDGSTTGREAAKKG
jgi:hypothetical protein